MKCEESCFAWKAFALFFSLKKQNALKRKNKSILSQTLSFTAFKFLNHKKKKKKFPWELQMKKSPWNEFPCSFHLDCLLCYGINSSFFSLNKQTMQHCASTSTDSEAPCAVDSAF